MKPSVFVLFAALVISSSCQQSNQESSEIVLDEQFQKNEKWAADTTVVPAAVQVPDQAGINQDWDKKIVRKGFLQVEVKNFKKYSSDLDGRVKQAGGYIAGEETQQAGDRIENRVIIKVPVGQFAGLMVLLTNTKEKVLDKKVSSDDVTTEIVDTRSRIEAKKKIRQRYLDLLQQAKSMEDILRIQSEINNVQEQIELGEGRAAYLSHSSAMSTIELTYFQLLTDSVTNHRSSFAVQLRTAFAGGWDAIKLFLVVLVSIWPFLLLLVTGLFFYKRTKVSKVKTV